MRPIFMRLCVCVLAVAVAFNGALLRSALSAVAQNGPANHAVSTDANHRAHDRKAHDHGVHDGHAGGEKSVTSQARHGGSHADHAGGLPGSSHDHANNAAKCCTMCLVVTHATPVCAVSPVMFGYAAVRFKLPRQTLAEHLVPLDPDIPKSTL
jgi:hypothetical protein